MMSQLKGEDVNKSICAERQNKVDLFNEILDQIDKQPMQAQEQENQPQEISKNKLEELVRLVEELNNEMQE